MSLGFGDLHMQVLPLVAQGEADQALDPPMALTVERPRPFVNFDLARIASVEQPRGHPGGRGWPEKVKLRIIRPIQGTANDVDRLVIEIRNRGDARRPMRRRELGWLVVAASGAYDSAVYDYDREQDCGHDCFRPSDVAPDPIPPWHGRRVRMTPGLNTRHVCADLRRRA